jgi:tetratricopeptide (TPR) repeat protein
MPRLIVIVAALSAILPAAAQTASALPADRLALANQLSRRGLYADALKEYEALRDSTAVPRDEVLFRLGETYRLLERKSEALKCYEQLLANVPESRYTDYARLNRAALLDGSARDKELRELDQKMRQLETAERNTLLTKTARSYGLSKENAKEMTEAVKAIYQATGSDGHRHGFGGRGGPGGPPPGGPR